MTTGGLTIHTSSFDLTQVALCIRRGTAVCGMSLSSEQVFGGWLVVLFKKVKPMCIQSRTGIVFDECFWSFFVGCTSSMVDNFISGCEGF